ncbi:hypothetical protein SMACR_09421 [Sordaria macrospora]|uniref:WGS project CABT00000000 data, contig 2.90 n=2 Tax=Sordaria macrospora TaxID=5147 RepID=F7WBZ7_SORMK|nr:uncharacterized protein SMAC_09421 [Sordaria macrospora k-hell]KAA8624041.1 hypothetical protein SMACR_09421 [Sordaria macrospora]WPJ64085.1 hypothetical protein SMAC4_09421 [Sordaria macrospora]CCC14522.1 unnamed protein product [Sordaria macrospora k-hell]
MVDQHNSKWLEDQQGHILRTLIDQHISEPQNTESPSINEPQPGDMFQSISKRDMILQEARVALRGERLPYDYVNGLLYCVIRGIRHNEAFARSQEVVKQCRKLPESNFARARNARLIMSNQIPKMATDDAKPYCFWHPDIPSERTIRRLVNHYPDMAYLAGRACAVAGYHELYHELDLLPEVSIAEEAREQNNPGSKAIFEHIMKQPVCYAVLDDYTRTNNYENPRCPAFMNGDTAVRSTLDVTVAPEDYWGEHYFNLDSDGFPFDITEDGHIGEVTTHTSYNQAEQGTLPPEHVELLYLPLPLHLPTMVKDPLIIMAAYEGNLDRYLRLRRPHMIMGEHGAVLRGIYHNTTFAKWWSLQPRDGHNSGFIRAATLARFIMVNDLSHMTENDPDPEANHNEIPGMIWWPLVPAERTLEVLAKRRPDMHLQVAMACIAGNYKELWDKLAPEPSKQLWDMATSQRDASVRNHFVEYLERRASELGQVADDRPLPQGLVTECDYPAHDWCWDAARVIKEPFDPFLQYSPCFLPRDIVIKETDDRFDMENIYGAFEQPCMARWELRMCATVETMAKIPDGEDGLRLYDDCGDDEQGPSTKDTETNNSLEVSSKEADDDDVEASSQDNDGNITPRTDHDPS